MNEASEKIAKQVVEMAQARGATVAEAVLRTGAHLSATVRQRAPELVEEAGSRSLGLRVMLGQQVAVSHTSDLSRQGIERLVEDAVELARLSSPDSFAGRRIRPRWSTRRRCPISTSTIPASPTWTAPRRCVVRSPVKTPRFRSTRASPTARARPSAGRRAAPPWSSRAASAAPRRAPTSRSSCPWRTTRAARSDAATTGARRGSSRSSTTRSAVGEEAARRTLRKLGARKSTTGEFPWSSTPTGRARSSASSRLRPGLVDLAQVELPRRARGHRGGEPARHHRRRPADRARPGSRRFDGEGLRARSNVVVEKGVLADVPLRQLLGAQARPREHGQRVARRLGGRRLQHDELRPRAGHRLQRGPSSRARSGASTSPR
jgi:PmbA protein